MTIETEEGWNAEGDHDTSVSEEDLIGLVQSALTTVHGKCRQRAMAQMASIALSDNFKVKISKGLHQEEGSLVSEKHVTLDEPDWPRPKRFHLYFLRLKIKKGGWRFLPSRLTHVSGGNIHSFGF